MSGLLLLIGGLQYRLWVGEGSLAHVSTLSTQLDTSAAGNKAMAERNAVLKAEIVDLKQGVDAIEEKARSEFGLIKRDETFFLLVED
ncbi:MAG: septum formation initiator family protein [Proteobacteria bacterium]|jgi:cell division protein FtsB|nr:septum formation initiator family protein [Pseudomonadota bacterium]